MKQQSLIPFSILAIVLAVAGCSVSGVYIHPAYPSSVPAADVDSIRSSLFLIGDAGQPIADSTEPTFRTLTRMAGERSAQNVVIFLGDNVYPKGLPVTGDPERKEMERRLDEQIAIGSTSGARTIFVPGNHDWEYQGKSGLEAIRREEDYIRSKQLENVTLLPKNGTPGPHAADVNDGVRIIVIDTQWWLHAFEKPFYPGDTSAAQTERRWIDSLSSMLAGPAERTTIVVAHHPLRTHGEHGGFFDWKDHLFPLRKIRPYLWIPLPGIGSLYPLSRMTGISDQDLSGERNRTMVKTIDSLMLQYRPIAYAAGHEHTLQVLRDASGFFYLVSGNGIEKHTEALTWSDDTILATREKGFMRMDVLTDGRVRLGVINSAGTEIFSILLR
jgi:hypothetical protein